MYNGHHTETEHATKTYGSGRHSYGEWTDRRKRGRACTRGLRTGRSPFGTATHGEWVGRGYTIRRAVGYAACGEVRLAGDVTSTPCPNPSGPRARFVGSFATAMAPMQHHTIGLSVRDNVGGRT